jgi:hypothetical protein
MIGKTLFFCIIERLIIFNSVGYSPLVNMNSAHHMLTYACGTPASQSPFWFVTFLFFEIIDNDFYVGVAARRALVSR